MAEIEVCFNRYAFTQIVLQFVSKRGAKWPIFHVARIDRQYMAP